MIKKLFLFLAITFAVSCETYPETQKHAFPLKVVSVGEVIGETRNGHLIVETCAVVFKDSDNKLIKTAYKGYCSLKPGDIIE